MRYLVAIHHPDDYDASREDEAMHRDIGALNQEMVAAGVRVFVGGLRSASSAKSLRAQPGGKVLITDGPYLETKEHIGGFWVLEAANLDEALAWGRKDGVIQGGGGPKEDTSGGFAYGGWSVPHHDPDAGAAIVAAHGEAFDLLLGRRTYDIWSGFWPKAPKSSMADSINAATKYVATHRPKSLEWGPVEGLGPDIVEGVRRLKAKNGPHLIVWGSSTLVPVLLEHELADEVLLLVFPVLLGTGKRIFSDGTPPRELALVSTKAVSSGVIISTYRPSGPLRTGSFDDAAA